METNNRNLWLGVALGSGVLIGASYLLSNKTKGGGNGRLSESGGHEVGSTGGVNGRTDEPGGREGGGFTDEGDGVDFLDRENSIAAGEGGAGNGFSADGGIGGSNIIMEGDNDFGFTEGNSPGSGYMDGSGSGVGGRSMDGERGGNG